MAVQSKFLSFALFGMSVLRASPLAALAASRAGRRIEHGNLARTRPQLPDFSLIDQHGREFGAADLRGRWSLLFFGYTNCPDFCPSTLTTLAAVQKRLREGSGALLPQVVFVSVDAKRDTPAHLAAYVPNFAPEFIGLTAADQPTIEAFARTLGVSVSIEPTANGDYIVNHSALIFVLDPEGGIAAILTGPFTVEPLAADFRRIVAARGRPAGRTEPFRPAVRGAAIPAAAAPAVAADSGGDPRAHRVVQELDHTRLSQVVPRRHERGGRDRSVELWQLQ